MSRKPDYIIKALNKITEERDKIGAAWVNKDGSITIVFNPFVSVPVGIGFLITAFPNKEPSE